MFLFARKEILGKNQMVTIEDLRVPKANRG